MSPKRKSLFFRLSLVITAVLLTAQACVPFWVPAAPASPNPSQVAQHVTMYALQTQFQGALFTLNALESAAKMPTATYTATPVPPPTSAPTWTPTVTSLPPTAPAMFLPTVLVVTATPGVAGQPLIYAEINTNCRSGPSSAYRRLGYLLVGENSEVFGRNNSYTWWYIREPRRPGILCWVWGGSTQVVGETVQVPVIIPTAQPAKVTSTNVSFSIRGIDLINCGGEQTVMVRVRNTGRKRLESASLQIYDLTTARRIFGPSSSNRPFRASASDCSAGGDHLNPGETLFVGASLGGRNVTGHRLEVDIRMCTLEGLSGQCYWNSASGRVP